MIVNIVVFFALALTCIFIGSWALSAKVRQRIEQPKYDFLNKVCRVDERAVSDSIASIEVENER